MTAPKDRDALIEVMAQALYESMYPMAVDWKYLTNFERSPYTERAAAILTALETCGVFVGPVVATDRMVKYAWEKDGNKTMDGVWAAMQSANPYRKE